MKNPNYFLLNAVRHLEARKRASGSNLVPGYKKWDVADFFACRILVQKASEIVKVDGSR